VVKERFSSLFNLTIEKKIYGKDISLSISFEGGGWRRNLFTSEVELVEECKVLLSNISLQNNIEDIWI